jgi:hypothetical protein
MNNWMIIGIVLAIVFAFLIYQAGRRRSRTVVAAHNSAEKPQPSPVDVYVGLRDMALKTPREKIGLPAPASPTTPWRVVMDWRLASGALATVVAAADGSASLYWGSGGGQIGGQAHESVRNAAVKAVKIAGELQPQMRLTTEFPLPESGGVIFYAVTDAGVFTSRSTTEEEMRTRLRAFSKLGDAVQEIISAYRAIPENKTK